MKEFFKNGVRFLLPILFLQTLLFVISMIFFVMAGVLIVAGAAIMGVLFTHSPLVGILLILIGIPIFLICVLLLLAFGAYVFLWKAQITRLKDGWSDLSGAAKVAWDSMWEAGRKFRENRWRAGIGLTVAFLVYAIVSFVLRLFLGLMGHLPFIGALFDLLDLVSAIGLVVLLMNYMSALSVAYLLEEEM